MQAGGAGAIAGGDGRGARRHGRRNAAALAALAAERRGRARLCYSNLRWESCGRRRCCSCRCQEELRRRSIVLRAGAVHVVNRRACPWRGLSQKGSGTRACGQGTRARRADNARAVSRSAENARARCCAAYGTRARGAASRSTGNERSAIQRQ